MSSYNLMFIRNMHTSEFSLYLIIYTLMYFKISKKFNRSDIKTHGIYGSKTHQTVIWFIYYFLALNFLLKYFYWNFSAYNIVNKVIIHFLNMGIFTMKCYKIFDVYKTVSSRYKKRKVMHILNKVTQFYSFWI